MYVLQTIKLISKVLQLYTNMLHTPHNPLVISTHMIWADNSSYHYSNASFEN